MTLWKWSFNGFRKRPEQHGEVNYYIMHKVIRL
jgi:hypothetical protein